MNDTPMPSSLSAAVVADHRTFPFRTELSLDPVVRFRLDADGDDCAVPGVVAQLIRERLAQVPS